MTQIIKVLSKHSPNMNLHAAFTELFKKTGPLHILLNYFNDGASLWTLFL